MAEFVMNKTQRLAFDASSASGILLFREVSKVPLAPPIWRLPHASMRRTTVSIVRLD